MNLSLTPQNPIIIIPSRLASTRLPNKPLADIHGEPMIVHVWRRATESKIGPVVVACDDESIADVIRRAGGRAILTAPHHPSGSDRIWEALLKVQNHETFDAVINVQGDEPTLDPHFIKNAFDLLKEPAVDIATLASIIRDDTKKNASQVAKPALELEPGKTHGRALYFSRLPIPSGEGPCYHHIGLYAYKRQALERFVKSPPSFLEKRERLEQLRALTLGMRIEVGIVEGVPHGVDTPEDLEMVRRMMGEK